MPKQTPFGKGIVGQWQNIVTVSNTTMSPTIPGGLRIVSRYIVSLECGHQFLVHPDVKLVDDCYFNPAQKAFYCTQCPRIVDTPIDE